MLTPGPVDERADQQAEHVAIARYRAICMEIV